MSKKRKKAPRYEEDELFEAVKRAGYRIVGFRRGPLSEEYSGPLNRRPQGFTLTLIKS